MNESPAAILYNNSGSALAVTNGVALPASTSALLMAGITNTNTASFVSVDGSGSVGVVLRDPLGITSEVGTDNVLRVGRDVLLFQDTFDIGINPNIWTEFSSSNANFDSNVSGSLVVSCSNPASGSHWRIETAKRFGTLTHWPLTFGTRLKISSFATGSMFEFGQITGSIGQPPSDGYFFRIDPTGSLSFVFSAQGVESRTSISSVSAMSSTWRNFHAEIGEERFIVRIEDTENSANSITKLIPRSNSIGSISFSHLPFMFKTYNNTVLTGSTSVMIDHAGVLRNDLDSGYDWEHAMAGMGRNCISDPLTFAQATNVAISAGPVTASLSTVTPSYTTLGGDFAIAAITGSEQSYNLFAYQIPNGYQLFLRTITINVFTFGAAIGGTPTTALFYLGVNSFNVSLLTPGLQGPRIIPLGMMFGDNTSKIGAVYTGSPISYQPTVPIAVDAGKFINIILKIPVGLATNGQIIRGTVSIDGFFH